MTERTIHRLHDQAPFDVRLDWGPHGLRALAPSAGTVVIVDVLSFTTAVTVAVEAGAEVLPYRWRDGDEAAFARSHGALLAGPPRSLTSPSLSPTSLTALGAGQRIVLPSANGSALSFAARTEFGAENVLAASLRNASAVAASVELSSGPVAVIAAGERWRGATGPMRVAVEDLIGAGAVIAALPPALRRSAEARAAAAAFVDAAPALLDRLASTASGRELIEGGFGPDVLTASAHDVTDVVPRLVGEVFRAG